MEAWRKNRTLREGLLFECHVSTYILDLVVSDDEVGMDGGVLEAD